MKQPSRKFKGFRLRLRFSGPDRGNVEISNQPGSTMTPEQAAATLADFTASLLAAVERGKRMRDDDCADGFHSPDADSVFQKGKRQCRCGAICE